ncbi:MAG TPA: cyclophilin-like fold protein [Syntrophorhabdales bacterium]|nr:cyclophilin-like fold protein [Syntrophorhabdales bacterium]
MKIAITNLNRHSPENIFYFFSFYFIFLLHRSVIGLILIFNESLLHKDLGRMQNVPARVKIVVDHVELDAEFFDTECAKAIGAVLPIHAKPSVWGDEFYFEIPVRQSLDETATTKVSVGDIGYWPPGSALAIFFGPTPMSQGSEPVPASAVNLVGRVHGDATILKSLKRSSRIAIEHAQQH